MSDSAVTYTATEATEKTDPERGMIRQVLAYNPHVMLVRHTFEKGWKGARHSHSHHQMVYVVRGHSRSHALGKSWVMRSGDIIVVDGGFEHQASAVEPSEVLDVLTPYRQEYA